MHRPCRRTSGGARVQHPTAKVACVWCNVQSFACAESETKVITVSCDNVFLHFDLAEQPEKEAAKRELTFGTNRLPEKKHASILGLMWEALKVPLIMTRLTRIRSPSIHSAPQPSFDRCLHPSVCAHRTKRLLR